MELRSTRLAIRAENKAREQAALESHKEVNPDSFEGRYAKFDNIVNPGCEYCGENHYG
jgi:hypothetical protein